MLICLLTSTTNALVAEMTFLNAVNLWTLPRHKLCAFFSLEDLGNGRNYGSEPAAATKDEETMSCCAHLKLTKP